LLKFASAQFQFNAELKAMCTAAVAAVDTVTPTLLLPATQTLHRMIQAWNEMQQPRRISERLLEGLGKGLEKWAKDAVGQQQQQQQQSLAVSASELPPLDFDVSEIFAAVAPRDGGGGGWAPAAGEISAKQCRLVCSVIGLAVQAAECDVLVSERLCVCVHVRVCECAWKFQEKARIIPPTPLTSLHWQDWYVKEKRRLQEKVPIDTRLLDAALLNWPELQERHQHVLLHVQTCTLIHPVAIVR